MDKLIINIPKGKEIDLEKSDLNKGEIFFKDRLPLLGEIFSSFSIEKQTIRVNCDTNYRKLCAIRDIMLVADYLNESWIPANCEERFTFYLYNDKICIANSFEIHDAFAYFKTEELAEQAIKILGEKKIKLAFS